MKALLLRIGIDKGYGSVSPVFKDLAFQYIPIYNKNKKEIERGETRTYETLGIDKYLPEKLKDKTVHYDPEFETFTYGDIKNGAKNSLLNLSKGDLLVFYMGGRYVDSDKPEGCFIIGYFVVNEVLVWNQLTKTEKENVERKLAKNAHIISSKSKDNLFLIKGSKESRLLDRCIPFTETTGNPKKPYITTKKFQKKYGIREYIIRAIPNEIRNEKQVTNLKKLLGYE